jgi:sugar phosphate isomerase/epimerase
MTRPNRPRYAARLNAFKAKGDTILDMIGRAAAVGGLDAADLNYPDHFAEHDAAEVGARLADSGMAVNGLAMRYYTDPGFRLGAFTHPDAAVRRAAIDQTKAGIDTALGMGARLMTLWMGQDGFDYAFQLDYARAWDHTIAALEEVCGHAPECDVALEYKPNEPRAFALMPDVGTTLLAVQEAARSNIGVTLDFAHVLYADEMPAHAAHLVARHARLLGVHLNDGYGKRDDGLMVGTVHPVQTVELLVALQRIGYDGVIYFDTFPDHGRARPRRRGARPTSR